MLPTPTYGDPSVAFDSFGNLFLSYLATTDQLLIKVLQSSDGGISFPLSYSFSDSAQLDRPTIKTGPASVWIIFLDDRLKDIGASVPGLAPPQPLSWTPLTHIPGTQYNNNTSYSPSDLALGPNGQVAVVVQSAPQTPSNVRVSVNPYGLTQYGAFSTASTVATSQSGWKPIIPAAPNRPITVVPGLAWDRTGGQYRNRLYLIYTDSPAANRNNTDIYLIHSDNDGSNWSSPLKINTDPTTASQFFPRVAVDEASGKVAASWYDCRADMVNNQKTTFYAAVSSNGGQTFSASNVQLENGQSDISLVIPQYNYDYFDYTGLAFYGGYFYPAWADSSNASGDNPNGTSQMDIYVAKVRY